MEAGVGENVFLLQRRRSQSRKAVRSRADGRPGSHPRNSKKSVRGKESIRIHAYASGGSRERIKDGISDISYFNAIRCQMKKRQTVYTILFAITIFAVLWACDSKKTTAPTDSSTAHLKVMVKDEYGRPVVGGKLTTNPYNGELITNDEGRAEFENIEIRDYTLYIRRPNFPVYSMLVTPKVNGDEIVFVIPTEQPTAHITFPSNYDFVSTQNIIFEGEGFDPENGVLPDSLLVWSSNVDGELGYGSLLSVDSMSLGEHSISLKVTDFDGKSSNAVIIVSLVDYDPNTFFPMLPDAQWDYSHTTEKFSVVNTAGNIESWLLSNISVVVDKNNIRTTSMNYQVNVLNGTREYRYIVSDYLAKDGNSVIVTKTKENIKIWKGNPYGSPTDELDITTSYSPAFVLLEDVSDPAAGTTQTSNHLMVTWSYKDPYYGIREFSESFHIETTTEIGAMETVDINNQDVPAVPVTVSQSNSVRTWWLNKGIGIVKLSYNTFYITSTREYPTAILMNTNLSGLAGKSLLPAKAAYSFEPSGRTPVNDTPVPAEDGPERMKALREIFAGMAPR